MLSEVEKNFIIGLYRKGSGYKEISKITGKTRDTVRGICLRSGNRFASKRGPKFLLKKYDKLKIKRCINSLKSRNEKVNSRKVQENCSLLISRRTIRRHINSLGLKYRNMKKKICLSPVHKLNRLRFANDMLSNNHPWEKTVFTDEKFFSLDGPDSWSTFAYENERSNRIKRQSRGSGVMVWAMLTPNGLTSWKILQRSFKSSDYIEIISNVIVPLAKLNIGADFWLQQDNAPVHVSKATTSFLKLNGVKTIPWPSRSPDLNIAENLWKCLSSIVYDGPVIKNPMELKIRIHDGFQEINSRKRFIIRGLYNNIRSHLCKVIRNDGDIINE